MGGGLVGGGAGAGGFCANATGTRSPIVSASSTKTRILGFTDLFLGRKVLKPNLVGKSVQVKASKRTTELTCRYEYITTWRGGLAKRRYYVQRLIRFFLAHAVLPDNGELQLRRLTGNVYR